MDVLIQISTVKVNKLLQKSMRKVIVCYTCLLYSNLRDESKDYSWRLGSQRELQTLEYVQTF
ncbi:MAG TPA: hypothetical protein DEF48_07410 [Nostoc sp. UBA8866]|nr:hypothetical protein [Nostoc sp. UBA8866]